MGDQAILFEEVQCFKKDGTDVNLPPTATCLRLSIFHQESLFL
jgi:hypothetical protein